MSYQRPRPTSKQAWFSALCAVLVGCAGAAPVVNAGRADPFVPGSEPDPFRRLPDTTEVVAFEVGRCETDTDCVVAACGGATCSARSEEPLCVSTPVGDCLSKTDPAACGCVEHACRWERSPEVLRCARQGMEPATTQGKTGDLGDPYPARPYR